MNYAVVRNLLGKILIFLGMLMLIPLIFCIVYKEELINYLAFIIPAFASLSIGCLFNIKKASNPKILVKEGLVIVGLSWIAMSLFGCIPYLISGLFDNFFDAFFEITSGFTTTGASVLNDIEGVLYIKDLLPHLQKPVFRWQRLIRAPYFVPETKMIDDLLRDFQQNKVHIAIVVDEFGGTSGIVTMEDIIEEIVGEIDDEYDDEEKTYHRISNNTYLFQAKTLLADFYRIMGLADDFFNDIEGDADTLAGLLLELKGEFPVLNERLTYRNFTFEVIELDERRIVSIKVILGKA